MMGLPKSSSLLRRVVSPTPPVIFLIFSLGALCLTYPLARHPFSHIPLGDERVGTVPFFNLWTLQWNIDQLMNGYPDYWDAPIFAPMRGTFAFSETQPLSALLAAPLWLGLQSAAFGYNAVLILFLILNGWFTYWLLKSWRVTTLPALMAGLMMQSIPFVAQEMGVLQLIAIFGLIWTLFFLNQLLSRHRQRQSNRPIIIGLALGASATFFTCAYYGLFSIFFVPLFFLIRLRKRHFRPITWGQLILAGLLTLTLSAPFLSAQQQRIARHGLARSATIIENNSARLNHYTNFLDRNVLYGQILGRESGQGQHLFPGFALIVLAALGLFGGTQKKIKLYLILAVALALLLSTGLRFRWGDIQPYQWIRDYIPGFLQLRSPFRFAVLVQLHLVLLAGFGLLNLRCWLAPKRVMSEIRPRVEQHHTKGDWLVHKGCLSKKAVLIPIIMAGLAILESLALPLPLQSVPDLHRQASWQSWLHQKNPSPNIVMLPFAKSNKVADFEQTTRWMMESRYFQSNMVNGYSGFFPPDHAYLREQMLAFPTSDGLDLLHEMQVDYVVVHHNLTNSPTDQTMAEQLFLVYQDIQNTVAVYALSPPD